MILATDPYRCPTVVIDFILIYQTSCRDGWKPNLNHIIDAIPVEIHTSLWKISHSSFTKVVWISNKIALMTDSRWNSHSLCKTLTLKCIREWSTWVQMWFCFSCYWQCFPLFFNNHVTFHCTIFDNKEIQNDFPIHKQDGRRPYTQVLRCSIATGTAYVMLSCNIQLLYTAKTLVLK